MRHGLICWILFLTCSAVSAAQAVTTQHNDNQRTGANTAETILTPANVTTAKFGKIFTRTLDANVNGQVLYMPNMNIGGQLHNVIYCTTSTNVDGGASSLYAFDADDPTQSAPLFRIQLTNSAQWTTGAPVIDPATNIIYVLNKELVDSGNSKLHAFDITTGAEKPGSPVTITGSVPGTGDGSVGGTLTFNTAKHNCRSALLFANGSVYFGFAHNTDSSPYHGWVFKYSYNGTAFTQDKIFCTTPNGGLGGIWQTGKGIMADTSGNIYFTTGNGVFNQSTNPPSYSMCFMKLSPSLQVLDWFAPSNQLAFSNADQDVGNTGVLMIPGTTRIISGGTKYGAAHLVDSTNMGHIGATASSPDTCLQTISGLSSNIRQNVVAWNGGAGGTFVYLWGSGKPPAAYLYSTQTVPAGQLTVSSTNAPLTNGAALCVTSNGTSNGILWAIENGSNNVFRAFSATNLATELWNSSQNSARDTFGGSVAKWQFPTVVNGKAYIGTGASTLVAYSLFDTPPTVSAVSPSQGLTAGGTTISVTGTNFAVGTSVKVGTLACTNVVVNTPTSLTCVTPASTPAGTQGAFNLVVTNTGGSATLTSGYTYSDAFRAADNPANAVAGAFFRYYNAAGPTLPIFSTLTPFRTGAKINGTILPENTVSYPITQNDNFAMQITGYLAIPSDGTWTLYTASDAASRLYIGSQLAVDNNFAQTTIQTRKSVPMNLRQGLHEFTLQFAQSTGGFGCYLGWGSPDATPPIALDSDPFTGGTHTGPPPAANQIPDNAFFSVPPTWSASGSSNWSSAAAWNTDMGLGAFSPAAADTTYDAREALVLRFPAVGGAPYTSINDVANPAQIDVLELGGNIDGNTIQGNPLLFAGASAFPYNGVSGPAILQTGSGAATLSTSIVTHDTLTLGGNGAGVVTHTGALSNFVNAGTPTNLIKSGASTFVLAGDGSAFAAGTIAIGGGTLVVSGGLPNAGTTTISSGATLRGDGNGATTGIVGAITASGGSVWPGTTALTMQAKGVLTASSADFSSAGSLAIRVSAGAADAIPAADKLVVTTATAPLKTGGTSALNLSIAAQSGTYNDRTAEVVRTTAGNLITAPFANFTLVNPTGPVTGVALLYVDDTYTGSGAGGIVAVQQPGGAASPGTFAANRIVVRLAGNVTPVTIDSFSAKTEGGGVLLEWRTVSEFQNVGFNVYRRDQESVWSLVNVALIPGRITNAEAKTYRLYDWERAGIFEYKLESVSLQGGVETFAQAAGPVCVDALEARTVSNEGLAAATERCASSMEGMKLLQRLVRAGIRDPIRDARVTMLPRESSVANASKPSAVQSRDASVDQASATDLAPLILSSSMSARWFASQQPSTASSVAAKVVYSAPGVLAIPQSALTPGFDIRHVDIKREGVSMQALALTDDKLIVYAPGYQDDYTDKDALFLRAIQSGTRAGAPARATGLFNSTQPVNTDTPATARAEYHDVYFDYSLRPYDYPPWFSNKYLTGGSAQSFTLDTPGASAGAATLTLNLWSLTDTAHFMTVLVNGQNAGSAQWNGGNKMVQLTFQLDPGALRNGTNGIDIINSTSTNTESQSISFLHSMSIDYTRSLDASVPLTIVNSSTADKLYEVDGLPNENVWVVDARYSSRAALIPYETQARAFGLFRLRFTAPSGGTGQFLVVPAGQENAPLAISKRTVKPIASKPVYLSVGPAQFAAGVQPLLTQHQKEGLRGAFVDQEQLFDYYGYGRYGPGAIQAAVRATRPNYLLLLGRTIYDYRNYSGAGVDPLCPAFLVSTSFWAQATSDSKFGDLGRSGSGTAGFPEVAVGRLPVNDSTELAVLVNRILAYKAFPASGTKAHVAADRADPAVGDFAAQADALAQLHPEFTWQRNFLGVTAPDAAEVTAALTSAANGGASLLIYVGHGNSVRLGATAPRILDTSSVQAWTGNTIFLQATCNANWMANNVPGFRSLAMQALTQPQGGLAASIGTSTYMDSDCAADFMNCLLQNTNTAGACWGDALLATQKWAYLKAQGDSMFYADLGATEQLFGDPAMPVRLKLHAPQAVPGSTKGKF